MEHCLYLMNLEVWNIVYFYWTKKYGTFFMSNEPSGMEHCLFLMNLEVWNIDYF